MISAIVVNWNGKAYLPECLGALLAQEPRPAEILLVDNHSDDGSREWVAQNFPAVRVIDTGRNGGPCLARNVGMAQARHEVCILLDNDVVLEPGAIAAMLAVLQREPRAAMVQARSLCGDDASVIHYDGGELHFLGTLVLRNWFTPRRAATAGKPDESVGAAIALCFLTKKSLYEEVGGFDERLFILYEDNQFSYKLRMRGYTVHVAERALCTHKAGTVGLSVRKSTDVYSGKRTFLHSRNRWFVLLTCMRWRTFLLTVPAQLLYGAVYAAFGHQRGHWRDWWRGKRELLALIPGAIASRKQVQRGRTVPDRELLVALPMTLNPGLAERGMASAVRRSLDRVFTIYWSLVRRLCG